MFVRFATVVMRRGRVLFPFRMTSVVMVMRRLAMVMRRLLMMRCGFMVMFAR
jgi:hypothetical protein